MTIAAPKSTSREIDLDNGTVIGTSDKWADGGCYCKILTPIGIVGCAIFNLDVGTEFDEAYAIAKGTPEHPLREPEDLLDAKICGATPRALAHGISIGMTGREAAEQFLKVSKNS